MFWERSLLNLLTVAPIYTVIYFGPSLISWAFTVVSQSVVFVVVRALSKSKILRHDLWHGPSHFHDPVFSISMTHGDEGEYPFLWISVIPMIDIIIDPFNNKILRKNFLENFQKQNFLELISEHVQYFCYWRFYFLLPLLDVTVVE